MIKVLDNEGLARDPHSKAIIQINADALREHRRKKQVMKKLYSETQKVSDLEEKLSNQQREIDTLKTLVHQLINNHK